MIVRTENCVNTPCSKWHRACSSIWRRQIQKQGVCMSMDDVKIYGLCIERLKFQIANAKRRLSENAQVYGGHLLLESYNTGDPDDVIDILELYDINERSFEAVREKLDELAYTVSILCRETLNFGMTEEGYLGLYLTVGVNSRNCCKLGEVAVA